MMAAYPVNGVVADAAARVDYDIEADKEGFWKVFDEFDTDHSGEISVNELSGMVEALGLNMKASEVKAMKDEADTDKSGDIDFGEFVTALKKAAQTGATVASGQSFASVIKRRQNSVSMAWRDDTIGKKITIDRAKGTVQREGDGYACVLLSPWLASGRSGSVLGSVLFDVDAPAGSIWIGVVGKNFNDDGDHWNEQLLGVAPPSQPSSKARLFTAVHTKDGSIYLNGLEQANSKAAAYGKPGATRLQLDINMNDLELDVKILGRSQANADYETKQKVQLNGIKPEVAVAVCFGPTDDSKPSSVHLVGSSVETVAKRTRRSSKDRWDDDAPRTTLNEQNVGAVGQDECFG